MTDRELLEMAAKAAGLDAFWDQPRGSTWGCLRVRHEAGSKLGSIWNPLADDGDALRLAVKLAMSVSVAFLPVREDWVAVINPRPCPDAIGRTSLATEYSRDDPAAATRRAIVRAAAAIGEAMP